MSHEVQSPPLDPALLAMFRQEGAMIVAHERGLTAACRVKLVGVARKLGISARIFVPSVASPAICAPRNSRCLESNAE